MGDPIFGGQSPIKDGGYDVGYRACRCFWGREPGSVLRWLHTVVDLTGADVLDLGCGEGKNAAWLDAKGCRVTAVDVSSQALINARQAWPTTRIKWIQADVTTLRFPRDSYDLIIAYGLLHCLTERQIPRLIQEAQEATRSRGINVIVALNDRSQDLSAHPGLNPTLLPHSFYLSHYHDWEVLFATDQDLHEIHPHNNIPHTHSMTRIAARKISV
jgi:ubiquinone/menaquinone biosynthesis C-methylase UbiE